MPVLERLRVALTGTGVAQFAVTEHGTLACIPETPRSLVLLDRTGASQTAIWPSSPTGPIFPPP